MRKIHVSLGLDVLKTLKQRRKAVSTYFLFLMEVKQWELVQKNIANLAILFLLRENRYVCQQIYQ